MNYSRQELLEYLDKLREYVEKNEYVSIICVCESKRGFSLSKCSEVPMSPLHDLGLLDFAKDEILQIIRQSGNNGGSDSILKSIIEDAIFGHIMDEAESATKQ